MDKYDVVYDYRNEMGGPIWIVLTAVFVLTIFFFIIRKSCFFSRKAYLNSILIGLAGCYGIYYLSHCLVKNNFIRRMINNSEFLIVEGETENYNVTHGKYHYESFIVKGVEFEYSGNNSTFGFNEMGWPIYKNGQYVRIGYYSEKHWLPRKYNNYILLLEIKR